MERGFAFEVSTVWSGLHDGRTLTLERKVLRGMALVGARFHICSSVSKKTPSVSWKGRKYVRGGRNILLIRVREHERYKATHRLGKKNCKEREVSTAEYLDFVRVIA